MLLVAALLGAGLLRDGTVHDGLTHIRMVQPNAPQDQKWDPAFRQTILERDLEIHDKSTEQARQRDDFFRRKFE